MQNERAAIVSHYGLGGLQQRIQAGLDQLDGELTIEVLAPADDFHVGGRAATMHLLGQLDLGPDDRVLDLGSGIGGPARFIASATGAHVTGVDLTPEYVEVATWLTSLVGLSDRVSFEQGSITALPELDGSFTAATMLHVGMNIDDKTALCAEVASTLQPGGWFAIYDLVVTAGLASGPEVAYPMPWAASEATSHLCAATEYEQLLVGAGFEIVAVKDRTDAALAAFDQLAEAATKSNGPPPLGLHLVMGPEARTKIANLAQAIRNGQLAPTEILARLDA